MWQAFRIFVLPLIALAWCVSSAGCAAFPPLVEDVDGAVGGSQWRDKGGLHARISITTSDGSALTGTLLYETSTRRLIIQRLTGGALEQVGYSSGKVWTRGVPLELWQAYAQIFFYVSYLPAPFELRNDNVQVRELWPMRLGGQNYRVALVTKTSEGVKWAMCINAAEKIPRALIPLAQPTMRIGNSPGKGAPPVSKGYAVAYEDISFVEGVALPTRWVVWKWDSLHGVTGNPVATVVITDPSFGAFDPTGLAISNNEVFDSSGRWWR